MLKFITALAAACVLSASVVMAQQAVDPVKQRDAIAEGVRLAILDQRSALVEHKAQAPSALLPAVKETAKPDTELLSAQWQKCDLKCRMAFIKKVCPDVAQIQMTKEDQERIALFESRTDLEMVVQASCKKVRGNPTDLRSALTVPQPPVIRNLSSGRVVEGMKTSNGCIPGSVFARELNRCIPL